MIANDDAHATSDVRLTDVPSTYANSAGELTDEAKIAKLDDGECTPRDVLRARRDVLPMCSGVVILPTQTAQITARPQRVAFRPERLVVSNYAPVPTVSWWRRLSPWHRAPVLHGAADWLINDIKIGNRSQLAQSGDLPGDMFATSAIDSFVTFETAQTAMDVVLIVTYIGAARNGSTFNGAIIGTAAF